MKEISIQRNIPLPPRACLTGPIRRAMRKMKIGDSILITSCGDNSLPYHCARAEGISITIRKTNKEGWRIWRTA